MRAIGHRTTWIGASRTASTAVTFQLMLGRLIANVAGVGRSNTSKRQCGVVPPLEWSDMSTLEPAPRNPVQGGLLEITDQCELTRRRPASTWLPATPTTVLVEGASALSGVTGCTDEMHGINSELRERAIVLLLEIAVEDQVEIRWAV